MVRNIVTYLADGSNQRGAFDETLGYGVVALCLLTFGSGNDCDHEIYSNYETFELQYYDIIEHNIYLLTIFVQSRKVGRYLAMSHMESSSDKYVGDGRVEIDAISEETGGGDVLRARG